MEVRVHFFLRAASFLTSSDLIALFNEELQTSKLSFNANITEFRFPNGALGLRDVQISEGPGQLIGIMGASGAGKTTLMNVLAGIEQPTVGSVKINGFDINTEKESIHGVIGYVSQDDLLIEEPTVYENLYYNAKLCFANLSDLLGVCLNPLDVTSLDGAGPESSANHFRARTAAVVVCLFHDWPYSKPESIGCGVSLLLSLLSASPRLEHSESE